MLAYRSPPLRNGFSPSELMLGRKLRTSLPWWSQQSLFRNGQILNLWKSLIKLIRWDKSIITTEDIEHKRCPSWPMELQWRLKTREVVGWWQITLTRLGPTLLELPKEFKEETAECLSFYLKTATPLRRACKQRRRSQKSHIV